MTGGRRMKANVKSKRPTQSGINEKLQPNAFVAVVTLQTDGFLLGGARSHRSAPFVSKRNAEAWALIVVETNQNRQGYQDAVITSEIIPVRAGNPIPPLNEETKVDQL
jgi:hypothetical protein